MAQNFIKIGPIGADVPIQRAQGILYTKLRNEWCTALSGDTDYASYPRVYRQPYADGNGTSYEPSATMDGKEYVPVWIDDSCKLLSFFGLDDKEEISMTGKATAKGHLVFFAKVCELEDNGYRADAEVRRKLWNILSVIGCGFRFTEQVTGIDNVFREYKGSKLESLKTTDMSEWHCFRFNYELEYYPEQF